MVTPASSTQYRPPDELVPESPTSDSPASSTQYRPLDEFVPESPTSDSGCEAPPPKRQRMWLRGCKVLRSRIRDALQQVRVLIFVNVDDPKQCLDVRMIAIFRWKQLAWMALSKMSRTVAKDLQPCIDALKKEKVEESVLSSLLAHVLLRHVSEWRPLLSKLSESRQRMLARTFDARSLNTMNAITDRPNFSSWFQFQLQSNRKPSHLSMNDLRPFTHTRRWAADEVNHQAQVAAYDSKRDRAVAMSESRVRTNALKKEPEANVDEIERVQEKMKQWNKQEKLMIRRMRKYRLYPTAEQRQRLHEFMGTCRWTYNQAVSHFRKTNVSNAITLRDLYVTRTTRKARVYPEGMASPPEWVFNTPKTFRYNTLRKFQTNVKSAFSNLHNRNINHFQIQFKSRKKDGRYFTFCEDAANAKIEHVEGGARALLSISKLSNIPIKCDAGLEITNEIQITNTDGFWYAVIPQFVQPRPYCNTGRAVALDPGLKAFITGYDCNGNALHIARGTRAHLDKLRNRATEAQRNMALIKEIMKGNGHRSGRQWRAFARSKRAFECATAKMNNCVKELHYQTCAYLTKHYDTIVLPLFSSKSMVKKSSKRHATYNKMLLGLKHFQFRQLLKAKCEVMGKSLVVCSEMYSSQTCGRCSRLHLKIGNKDVFECPHCYHTAGRDVNAAFNILRFTCAGSLAVHDIFS